MLTRELQPAPVTPAAPVVAEPLAEEPASESADAPFDLTETAPEAAQEEELVLTPPSAEDELILGNESLAEPPVPNPLPAADASAEAPRPSWMTDAPAEDVQPDRPAPRSGPLGGTLFERMSSIARGAAKSDDAAKSDPLDIPRFLNRQNNQ